MRKTQRFALHFRTDQPASSAASVHVVGCRHANLRPRTVELLDGATKQDVMKTAVVDDLLARGFGVSFAPCTLEAK